jgi:hypothetical protein
MRILGFAIGLAAVMLALVAWRLPSVRPDLGAEAAFSIAPTGELEVEQSGVFLDAKGLRPGSDAQTGASAIRNQTGKALAVSLRALPGARDLDALIAVQVVAGPNTIFSGTLGGLRNWTKPLRLRSGELAPLRLRVRMPSTVRSGYAARIVSIPLELRSAA